MLYTKWSKAKCLWAVIGGFRSILFVSVFRGPMFVTIIMIDGSIKLNLFFIYLFIQGHLISTYS